MQVFRYAIEQQLNVSPVYDHSAAQSDLRNIRQSNSLYFLRGPDGSLRECYGEGKVDEARILIRNTGILLR